MPKFSRVFPNIFANFNYSQETILEKNLGGFIFYPGWDRDIANDERIAREFQDATFVSILLSFYFYPENDNQSFDVQTSPLNTPTIQACFENQLSILISYVAIDHDSLTIHYYKHTYFQERKTKKGWYGDTITLDASLLEEVRKLHSEANVIILSEDKLRDLLKEAKVAESKCKYDKAYVYYEQYKKLFPNHDLGRPITYVLKELKGILGKNQSPVVKAKLDNIVSDKSRATTFLNTVTYLEFPITVADILLDDNRRKILDAHPIVKYSATLAWERQFSLVYLNKNNVDDVYKHNGRSCYGVCRRGGDTASLVVGWKMDPQEVLRTTIHELAHFVVYEFGINLSPIGEKMKLDKQQNRSNNLKYDSHYEEIYATVVVTTDQCYEERARVEEYFVRIASLCIDETSRKILKDLFPETMQAYEEIIKTLMNSMKIPLTCDLGGKKGDLVTYIKTFIDEQVNSLLIDKMIRKIAKSEFLLPILYALENKCLKRLHDIIYKVYLQVKTPQLHFFAYDEVESQKIIVAANAGDAIANLKSGLLLMTRIDYKLYDDRSDSLQIAQTYIDKALRLVASEDKPVLYAMLGDFYSNRRILTMPPREEDIKLGTYYYALWTYYKVDINSSYDFINRSSLSKTDKDELIDNLGQYSSPAQLTSIRS